MKELSLTNSKLKVLIDDEDFDRLSKFNWYASKTVVRRNMFHYNISIANEIMRQDRSIMFDHADRNFLNNQKYNLRQANQSKNSMNKAKQLGFTSKYKGVCWSKRSNKWKAQIKFNGKCIHLGFFMSEEFAALAYNNKAVELFKEFACLNELPKKQTNA